MKKIIFVLLISLVSCSSLYAEDKTKEDVYYIRVCVIKEKPSLKLSIKGKYTIETLENHHILQESSSGITDQKVMPTNSGITVGEQEFLVYGIRIIPTLGANISINSKRFRGVVDIIRTKSMKLLVINHIDIEDYLFGVLYHEMPHDWPMQALMAQAVTARTYAVFRKEERKKEDYDLTNDQYSQMYGGKDAERFRGKWAVEMTKGKVLEYDNKILPCFYHSTCGGHTEDSSKIWTLELKPLKGRSCPYCKEAPLYNWDAIFSYKQIQERLNNKKIKCKDVKNIREGKRDGSGRLETVIITDKNGEINLPSEKFRLALGGSEFLKSTKFSIKKTKKGIIFKGHGWGHGVGMCQWGAKGMSDKGYDYDKILDFYYPGAVIKIIKKGDK